jgi:anti-sigma factor RsiW
MSDRPLSPVLRRLLGPGRPEVTCEVCFDELDRYVDLQLSGADAEAAVPGMRAHLQGCPACSEEYDSLHALTAEDASGPDRAAPGARGALQGPLGEA